MFSLVTRIFLAFTFLIIVAVSPRNLFAGRNDSSHFTITAQGLFDEYGKNEIAADEHYRQRQIIVGGIISKIGRDGEMPYVTLKCSETISASAVAIGGVKCYFPAERQHSLTQLQVGRTCSVYGTVMGKHNREIVLQDCSL